MVALSFADPPTTTTHAAWCATALHERRGVTCESLAVRLGSVFVWISQTSDGPRLRASGDAPVDRGQVTELIHGLEALLTAAGQPVSGGSPT
jgi:hypothetical protein